MIERLKFLAEYLKSLRTVGAATPSSRFLSEKIVRSIDFREKHTIVELGGGNGCISKIILERMRPDARLLVFEVNSYFARLLEIIRDQRLTVITDSAERLGEHLRRSGIEKVDCIISGLPLTSLPKPISEKIFSEIFSALTPGGAYVQFQYSLSSYRQFKKTFKRVTLDFTLLNFPPAFIYICER